MVAPKSLGPRDAQSILIRARTVGANSAIQKRVDPGFRAGGLIGGRGAFTSKRGSFQHRDAADKSDAEVNGKNSHGEYYAQSEECRVVFGKQFGQHEPGGDGADAEEGKAAPTREGHKRKRRGAKE